jgi:hypothetical protein
MNRKLLLVAVPVTTVLASTGIASGQDPDSSRVGARSLSASATPERDRTLPYTFTTTGRLKLPENIPPVCPPGITDERYCVKPTKAQLCKGVVTVRFQKKLGSTASSRNVLLKPDCTYSSRVTFTTADVVGELSVRSRFQGNQFVRPRNSNTDTVRAG